MNRENKNNDFRVNKFGDDFVENLILINILEELRHDNKVIVFTNGVFDIIHKGHIQYLHEAKKLGGDNGVLIVGINSDNSVRRIKGDKRPIVSEKNRAFVLSCLKPVDYVVIFDDETPYDLIELIKPKFLVKGADWEEDSIVGASMVKKYGGTVKRINFLENNSSTNIIDEILKKFGSG